ncbi:hypothetical protein ACLBPJ_29280, partial [Klebsiella pneumoniae]
MMLLNQSNRDNLMHTDHSLKISKKINFLVQVEARINELYQQRQNMSIDQYSKECFNESHDVDKQDRR